MPAGIRGGIPMVEGLSWTVKGVTPEEREQIVAGAMRAGMKVGRYVVAACQIQIEADRAPLFSGRPEGPRDADNGEASGEASQRAAPPVVLAPLEAIERLARLAIELSNDNPNDATTRLARGVVRDQLRRFRPPRLRRLVAPERMPGDGPDETVIDGKD
jgi:hypothetical protein